MRGDTRTIFTGLTGGTGGLGTRTSTPSQSTLMSPRARQPSTSLLSTLDPCTLAYGSARGETPRALTQNRGQARVRTSWSTLGVNSLSLRTPLSCGVPSFVRQRVHSTLLKLSVTLPPSPPLTGRREGRGFHSSNSVSQITPT